MPQSLAKILVHLVFSTKDRAPFLHDEVRRELHAYLATVVRNAGCECVRVGGVADHVHLAVRLSRTMTVADLVEETKTSSSKWLKARSPRLAGFSWQRGYGAFSFSPKNLADVTKYIDAQEEHHRRVTFEEEFRRFLAEYEMEFDERFVWD